MIAGVTSYPSMKDSGVKWLGLIPEHWEILRGKVLFRCIDVRSATGEEELLTVSSDRGIVPRESAAVTMFKAESYVGHKLCWPGDLVINSLWAWSRGLGISQYHGIVSTAYGVYRLRRPMDVSAAYIDALVRSIPFNWELRVRSKGIWISRLQLSDDAFLGAPFPVPPASEQPEIARFLDLADRRIRRYIRSKERLIELLEEQKQATIHQAVTGQIDVRTGQPYPAYKDSSVEWLGKVPAHWDIRRLKNAGKAIIGLTYDPRDVVEEDCGVLVLRASNISEGHIVDADNVFVRGPVPRHLITRMGDILLCSRSGSRALIGKNARIGATSAGVTFGAFMTVFRGVNNDYLHRVFNSKVFEHQSGAFFTSTINQLTLGILYSIKVPWPPVEERGEIVGHIARGTAHVAIAIAKARRQIDLAQEYRTRLIADVVTGKFDVGEATASLPEVDPLAVEDTPDESIGRISEANPMELDPTLT